MDDVRFYGYKHWTFEEVPRCFYVGKGLLNRPSDSLHRNHKWKAITKRLGRQVEVCFGPVTNEEAITWEIENIEFEKTFTINHSHDDDTDIGCNFTLGGEGMSGHKDSKETRERKKQAQIIAQNKPEVKIAKSMSSKGRQKTDIELQHIREANNTPESKEKHRNANKGRKYTGQALQNMRDAAKRPEVIEKKRIASIGRTHNESARKAISEAQSKPVARCDDDGNVLEIFCSITIAQQSYKGHIADVCRGERPRAAGFKWRYI